MTQIEDSHHSRLAISSWNDDDEFKHISESIEKALKTPIKKSRTVLPEGVGTNLEDGNLSAANEGTAFTSNNVTMGKKHVTFASADQIIQKRPILEENERSFNGSTPESAKSPGAQATVLSTQETVLKHDGAPRIPSATVRFDASAWRSDHNQLDDSVVSDSDSDHTEDFFSLNSTNVENEDDDVLDFDRTIPTPLILKTQLMKLESASLNGSCLSSPLSRLNSSVGSGFHPSPSEFRNDTIVLETPDSDLSDEFISVNSTIPNMGDVEEGKIPFENEELELTETPTSSKNASFSLVNEISKSNTDAEITDDEFDDDDDASTRVTIGGDTYMETLPSPEISSEEDEDDNDLYDDYTEYLKVTSGREIIDDEPAEATVDNNDSENLLEESLMETTVVKILRPTLETMNGSSEEEIEVRNFMETYSLSSTGFAVTRNKANATQVIVDSVIKNEETIDRTKNNVSTRDIAGTPIRVENSIIQTSAFEEPQDTIVATKKLEGSDPKRLVEESLASMEFHTQINEIKTDELYSSKAEKTKTFMNDRKTIVDPLSFEEYKRFVSDMRRLQKFVKRYSSERAPFNASNEEESHASVSNEADGTQLIDGEKIQSWGSRSNGNESGKLFLDIFLKRSWFFLVS
jgi:hypothetical protein